MAKGKVIILQASKLYLSKPTYFLNIPVILFVMLRVIVGSMVAVIIGPILTKNRSKPNKF